MTATLILASGSEIRAKMLRDAQVRIDVSVALIDEEAIKQALLAEEAAPRDIADALADGKARKVSSKNPGAMVLGCDQILNFNGTLLSKPRSMEEARSQLVDLRGQTHQLLSAAVIYKDSQPIWRHVGVARLTMRSFSDTYLDDYLARNWPGIGTSVGAYKLEEEGVRLFSRIHGDHFTILGLPLIELLNFLSIRGTLPA